MHAINAIYDGAEFKPQQPIPIEGQYRVVITFIEPLQNSVEKEAQTKKRSRADFIGSWKGRIWMSDDFDEPLEEFEEYM